VDLTKRTLEWRGELSRLCVSLNSSESQSVDLTNKFMGEDYLIDFHGRCALYVVQNTRNFEIELRQGL
jgi:hypothetical protein